MQEDFIVLTTHGLYCKTGDFFLDPRKPVRQAVITHAHADHAVAGNNIVYATDPTVMFMALRYKHKAGSKINVVPYKESFRLNEVVITFFPAGHILGSAQVLMEYQNVKYLYTGDFKLQPDSTCEPFEFVSCDVLITESTFANPEIKHPDDKTEIKKLNSISDKNIIIGTYALGKAQRLSRLINDHCPDKVCMLHKYIVPHHKVYEQFRIITGAWMPYQVQRFKHANNVVYLVPPAVLSSYINSPKYHTAFASGWDHLQQGHTLPLFISDHADWNDLLILIEKTGAKKIITLHGDGSKIKEYFKEKAIEVICY